MKNAILYNPWGMHEAWSNLNFYRNTSMTEVQDAIEDSSNGLELVAALLNINMVCNNWVIDRETTTKVRLKYTAPLGNRKYLECEKG